MDFSEIWNNLEFNGDLAVLCSYQAEIHFMVFKSQFYQFLLELKGDNTGSMVI
jgi:hypothetical protein